MGTSWIVGCADSEDVYTSSSITATRAWLPTQTPSSHTSPSLSCCSYALSSYSFSPSRLYTLLLSLSTSNHLLPAPLLHLSSLCFCLLLPSSLPLPWSHNGNIKNTKNIKCFSNYKTWLNSLNRKKIKILK